MNALELVDELVWIAKNRGDSISRQLADIVRQQQAEINQQQDEKKALYNLVAEQDKKIIDLAFKLAYAERSNEIVLEVNTRSRP